MKINQKSILISIFLVILICFFIIITINDLEISKSIADLTSQNYLSQNEFAMFFEIMGESVLFLAVAFAFGILFCHIGFNATLKVKKIIQFAIFGVIILVFFIGFNRTIGYLEIYELIKINWLFYVFFIFLSIFLTFLTILLLNYLNYSQIKALSRFALLILFIAIFSNLSVQLFKGGVFSRVRFRTLFYISDFNFYSPWYSINGPQILKALSDFDLPIDAFRSFPSGHTSAVCVLFSLYVLPKIIKIKKLLVIIFCYFLPTTYIFLVAFSRIVAGAHFATDVFFSIILTAFFTIIGSTFILKKKTKLNKFSMKYNFSK